MFGNLTKVLLFVNRFKTVCYFDQYNIVDAAGQKVIKEYQKEIIEFSKSKGYDPEYLYTPALINPATRKVLFYPDKPPSKEEVVKLAS